MTGLTLIGLDDDGAHLVVQDAGGALLRLPVTDELRRAVRRAAPPVIPAAAETPSASMSPREIQQRLRAGLTAVELAEVSGVSLETIEKFSAPVLAERRYVIDQAQGTRIGRDHGAPVLYDLVMDRLAARGVSSDSVTWEAWRTTDEPWRVAADFRTEGRSVRATWTYDHTARSLTAEDEESRWLTETELLDAPIPRRHLSAVRPASSAPAGPTQPPASRDADRVMSDGAPPSAAIQMPDAAALSKAPALSPTEALLADLEGRRGTREAIDDAHDESDEDGGESFGPAAHVRTANVNFGGADGPSAAARAGHPAGSGLASPAAPAAATVPDDAGSPPPTPAGGERKPKRGRASVPSWDEIVFGARQQQQD